MISRKLTGAHDRSLVRVHSSRRRISKLVRAVSRTGRLSLLDHRGRLRPDDFEGSESAALCRFLRRLRDAGITKTELPPKAFGSSRGKLARLYSLYDFPQSFPRDSKDFTQKRSETLIQVPDNADLGGISRPPKAG